MRRALDPSHLVALSALLELGSVTGAAERLGITQSSMSHRLAQLRLALGDPLLVRAGATLVPTARARAIAEPLAAALRALHEAVAEPTPFDPSTSELTVRVAMPDLLATVAPRLVAAFASEAPHLQLRVTSIGPSLDSFLADDVPSVALTPTRFVGDGVLSRAFGDLRFAVVGRRAHPALRRPLTAERWLAYPHVVVEVSNERTNLVEDAIAARGLARRVGLVVPSFLAGLHVVASSDLLMNVPVPLVSDAVEALGLRLRDAPIALPSVRFALAWHARHQHDPAHAWARERIYGAVRPAFKRAR